MGRCKWLLEGPDGGFGAAPPRSPLPGSTLVNRARDARSPSSHPSSTQSRCTVIRGRPCPTRTRRNQPGRCAVRRMPVMPRSHQRRRESLRIPSFCGKTKRQENETTVPSVQGRAAAPILFARREPPARRDELERRAALVSPVRAVSTLNHCVAPHACDAILDLSLIHI